jgi:hypothetical protein
MGAGVARYHGEKQMIAFPRSQALGGGELLLVYARGQVNYARRSLQLDLLRVLEEVAPEVLRDLVSLAPNREAAPAFFAFLDGGWYPEKIPKSLLEWAPPSGSNRGRLVLGERRDHARVVGSFPAVQTPLRPPVPRCLETWPAPPWQARQTTAALSL